VTAPTDDRVAPAAPPAVRRRVAAAAAALLALTGAVLLGYGLGQQQQQPGSALADVQGVSPEAAPPAPPVPSAAGRAAVVTSTVLPSSRPTTISVPAIGVRSVVNDVGLAPDGTMEVPVPGPEYDQAAWFDGSPTPGALGPAVVIGHVDSAKDGPSIFFKLGQVKPGQRIDVGRADGTKASFEVEAVKTYAKDAFPLETVYGNTDHAALRLITCGGSFDERRASYRDNVVVFARLTTT